MVWWKDNDDAAFTGIGEVSRGKWVDGSAIPCAQLSPPGLCLHVPYANYNVVEISLDGGGTWLGMTQIAGDHWRLQTAFSGLNWQFDTDCGMLTANLQGLQIQQNFSPFALQKYPSSTYAPAYPATWTYKTTGGSPSSWPGTTVQIRTRCNCFPVATSQALGSFNASLGLPWPTSAIAGDSALAVLFQTNNIVSGGAIPQPVISAEWSLVHQSSDYRLSVWLKPNEGAARGLTVSGLASSPVATLCQFVLRTPPGAAVRASNFQDNTGAANHVSAGSITYAGDVATMMACYMQYAANINSGTSLVTCGDANFGQVLQDSRAIPDSASGTYTKLFTGSSQWSTRPAGTYTTSASCPPVRPWYTAFVAVR